VKVIIAGSRHITEYAAVVEAVKRSGFEITEVVSGTCRGVDKLGERWAEENGVPIKRFPADWDHDYDNLAGFARNGEMASYADALLLVWDGRSPGSKNVLLHIKHLKKPHREHFHDPI